MLNKELLVGRGYFMENAEWFNEPNTNLQK